MAQKASILCAWRNIQKYPFQNGNSKSVGRSTDFIRLPPPPPMPKYPPGQYEQAQDECFARRIHPLAASSSSALEVGKQNKVHSTLTRYLRHPRSIFVPRNKLSEID
ncbi:hypothetical protein ACN38_g5018 [Penicillium nordicum]|uniref:Uncharacterized protein n=1 Tax=Penicillium nordicum TaxID=229535 RepID=A0A0M9WGJ9_9EURO|nr:hypothetical protein ACN38_g5018 [Penicillium nordicum]